MKHETFSRAKLEILNYVITFCTNTLYDGKYFPPFSEGNGFESVKIGGVPPIGSLVRLMAAPTTKWYLSWVVDVKEEAGNKCLLKSIEDGSLSWWENVGYYNIPLELSDKFPSWKYNDEQFSFWDKWEKANKWENTYVLRPMPPIFESEKVTLELRKIHSNDIIGSKTFPFWKKLTIREMREFIHGTFKTFKTNEYEALSRRRNTHRGRL